jgi:hypothetical protein
MTHYINTELRDADAVVRAFSDASVEFDPDILQQYLLAYPQHAERLKRYAQVWLMSNRASTEEINAQDISTEEMLPVQSRLLALWHNVPVPQSTNEDEGEVLKRLAALASGEAVGALTRKLLLSDDEAEEPLVIEYVRRGLTNEPRQVRARLANELKCSPLLAAQILQKYSASSVGNQTFHSSKVKPVLRPPRTWQEAVEELEISEQRKRQLLTDDESV